jgi:gamma-glutamylcyclotransferase (GGCT)/AIG2-like uncharacterized protein YtfP
MAHLFAYGSLNCPAVWQPLVQDHYSHCLGFLPGHQRVKIFLDNYPVVYPDTQQPGILGTVYLNISPDDWQRLDRFEGEIYTRTRCQVISAHGPLAAYIYQPKPQYHALLTQAPWHQDLFNRFSLPQFLQRYVPAHSPA